MELKKKLKQTNRKVNTNSRVLTVYNSTMASLVEKKKISAYYKLCQNSEIKQQGIRTNMNQSNSTLRSFDSFPQSIQNTFFCPASVKKPFLFVLRKFLFKSLTSHIMNKNKLFFSTHVIRIVVICL